MVFFVQVQLGIKLDVGQLQLISIPSHNYIVSSYIITINMEGVNTYEKQEKKKFF